MQKLVSDMVDRAVRSAGCVEDMSRSLSRFTTRGDRSVKSAEKCRLLFRLIGFWEDDFTI